MQEKEETVHQALYSGTEKRKGTPPPLIINKMTRRTWLRSDVWTEKKISFQKIFWKEKTLCGKKEKHFQKEKMEVS